MSKKLLILSSFILFYFLNIDNLVDSYFKSILLNLRVSTINIVNSINDYYIFNKNANKQIKILKDEINRLSKLRVAKNINNFNDKNLTIKNIEVVGYIDFNDFSKLFININNIGKKNIIKTILPLIDENSFVCGIIKKENNNFIAYLQNNTNSNYTVFIGQRNAPGISSGYNKNGLLKIKFIPTFYKINIGDLVISSGMDNIFQNGLKVGIVKKIIKLENDTKTVFVKTFCNINGNKFYTIL